uniref:Dermaseptin-S4 n=1 Tax=Phyllomedusa sauvagei TaxID=8395 RepID=DRS4_PHYSA|nr:RecName: Full=Dermaseptin-S4; Short=DRS-S4; AltName: Full=Dermaseptin IV; Short=DS IV; AltName: Full=Dermaseptin-4; Short=DS4 [Phyllomedusa sauvagii]
ALWMTLLKKVLKAAAKALNAVLVGANA